MKNKLSLFRTSWNRVTAFTGMGMRAKLLIIFLVIKVIPIVLLALVAWKQSLLLGDELNRRMRDFTTKTNDALVQTGEIAVNNSVSALNNRAMEDIERMTTEVARRIAEFLYERDSDVLLASTLARDPDVYRHFVTNMRRSLIRQGRWRLAPDEKSWIPEGEPPEHEMIVPSNKENDVNFNYRPPEIFNYERRPIYAEITFVDLDGNEQLKVTTSPRMNLQLKKVSDRLNTFARAETYWSELQKLRPGEIYVSEVIGSYVPSRVIGFYTPESAAAAGEAYAPRRSAYAGQENPLGRRFEGIIRWATPVIESRQIVGYVTLALDHDHLMEFSSHISSTQRRYAEIPSAHDGNYAFIWDHKGRCIAHPRHHSIVGYAPDTGDPQVPWLEDRIYYAWQASGKSYPDFIKDEPVFFEQSLNKKPSGELAEKGLVGLDGRYMNFAPQGIGMFDLTQHGGSGSFVIQWSGLTKLTTAAAIPYYTGQYNASRRGFGVVSIGADLGEFFRPAQETKKALDSLIAYSDQTMTQAASETQQAIDGNIVSTIALLSIVAGVMITLIVLVAVWMASVFTDSITALINGISHFRAGERHFRFKAPVKDELGTLADSFDEMADSLVDSVKNPQVIIDMDCKIIYANKESLDLSTKNFSELLGRPYGEHSLYPPGSVHCPITALRDGREAEVLYVAETGRYFKGKATHLTGKDGGNIGYIIESIDLTDIIRKQIELENAVLEANKANASKGEFLARMSHEIRTPMNAIIGMNNIVKKRLGEKVVDVEDTRSYVNQIETSSHHLLGLLNDILDISKIDSGKIELAEEITDLHKLSETVVSIIKPRCGEKNISFHAAFDVPPPANFMTDSLRLRQVLINLLGNAVKFTPAGGKVELSIAQKEKDGGAGLEKTLVEFSVRDSGIGITESVMATLFQPFEQGDSRISRRYGGTGLGLAISRRIVRLLGGDISVESKEGEGSFFSFNIWMTPAVPESRQELPDIKDITDVSGLFTGKKALVVDDVMVNRIIAADLLSSTGMDIDEADDGAVAVRMFEESAENTYDIIYMDVQMPVMDGYEAAASIRELDRPDAKTVPIVALTANAFKDDVERALKHGMNTHLAKPVEMGKLLEISMKYLLK